MYLLSPSLVTAGLDDNYLVSLVFSGFCRSIRFVSVYTSFCGLRAHKELNQRPPTVFQNKNPCARSPRRDIHGIFAEIVQTFRPTDGNKERHSELMDKRTCLLCACACVRVCMFACVRVCVHRTATVVHVTHGQTSAYIIIRTLFCRATAPHSFAKSYISKTIFSRFVRIVPNK